MRRYGKYAGEFVEKGPVVDKWTVLCEFCFGRQVLTQLKDTKDASGRISEVRPSTWIQIVNPSIVTSLDLARVLSIE